MKAVFEFLYPYRAILAAIGALADIALQFSPMARQFGEIAGNLCLVLAWVMLSALTLIWIDKWKPQQHGWKFSFAKNGLRVGVLLILFTPLLTFNLPFTDPTIKIIATGVSSYEVGKPVAVRMLIQNNNYSPKKARGQYMVFVAQRGSKKWPAFEEEMWAMTMSRPESDYPEFTAPTPDVHPWVILDGPVLTQDKVDGLRSTDDTSALYFMGVLTYSEWYGRSRRLEFCGSNRDRPNYMIVCANHSEWAEDLKRERKTGTF